MSKAIIEKDLWVCIILKYLFKDFKFKDYIVLKVEQVYLRYIN